MKSSCCVSGKADALRYRPGALLAVIAGCFLIAPISHSSAESLLDVARGRWTTRSIEECGKHYYDWSTAGQKMEFKDESGQVDIEDIININGTNLFSKTISSIHPKGNAEAPGTNWQYRFEPDGRVFVKNLATGKTFSLTKCVNSQEELENLKIRVAELEREVNALEHKSDSSATSPSISGSPTPTYNIRIHQITAFRIASHDNPVQHQTDTDWVTLAVDGTSSLSGPVIDGPREVNKNDQPTIDLTIKNYPVPHNANAVIKVSWSLINKGSNPNSDAKDDILKAAAQLAPLTQNPTVVVVAQVINGINQQFFASCDTPIGAGGVTLNGNDVYNGYHNVFDMNNVPNVPCSKDVHYNLELFIERNPS